MSFDWKACSWVSSGSATSHQGSGVNVSASRPGTRMLVSYSASSSSSQAGGGGIASAVAGSGAASASWALDMFGSSNSSRDSTRTWRMAEMLRGGQAACSEASGVLSNEGRVRRQVIEPAALIWAASESAGYGMERRNFIGSAALAALLPLGGGGSW